MRRLYSPSVVSAASRCRWRIGLRGAALTLVRSSPARPRCVTSADPTRSSGSSPLLLTGERLGWRETCYFMPYGPERAASAPDTIAALADCG